MPQQAFTDRALSDAELLSVFHSDEDLSALTPEEQQRLVTLTEPKTDAPAKAKSAADYLPMVGGAIGGLAGGSKASPVGMALAGVGGAAGEGYKQLLTHGKEIPGAIADVTRNFFSGDPAVNAATIQGAAQGMGEGALGAVKAGGEQALYEGGGRLIGAAVRPVAKLTYGLALRPAQALARNIGGGSAMRGASRLAEQGLEDAVLPSGMGLGRAEKLLAQSRQAAADIAGRNKTRVGTGKLLQGVEAEQVARMAEQARAGVRPNTGGLTDAISRMREANPAKLTMAELHRLKQVAQDVAAPAFKAAKVPGGVPPAYGSEVSVAKTAATQSRKLLNALLGKDYEAANRLSQSRGGLRDAVDAATSRGSMMQNVVAGGLGGASALMSGNPADALTTYALLRALSSPSAYGALAIALAKAPYAQLLRAGDASGVNDLSTDLPWLLQQALGGPDESATVPR